MSALHIRHLQHKYVLTEVLSDISLDLHAGETLALVGPSGCGKSTLLHIIAGLLTPSSGVIEQGFNKIACMFQEPRLLPWKTAQDNMLLGLTAAHVAKPVRQQQVQRMASALGLTAEDLNKYPHELSGGMQSRIALGRALIIQPDLLLLDEPFSALDIGLKLELYALLRQHITERATSVLMITHDLMEAVRLADRIIMMVPAPGRLLEAFALTTAHQQRSDAWIYQTTAALIAKDSIRIGFGMGASPLNTAEQPLNSAQDARHEPL